MTTILGISAFYHDAAAALLVDGRVVAAAEEERFTRKKHDASFPKNAIAHCLRLANLSAEQIDYVGFYEKPLLKFERLLETYLAFAPHGLSSFLRAMPQWLAQKLFIPREIKTGLGAPLANRIVFTEHHEAHAAAAFFPSPFEEAAIVVADGVGEWATGSIWHGRGERMESLCEQHFPHSLGLLYSAFTYYLGFRVNSGEYKVMGLAPYGKPRFVALIFDKLLDCKTDGSFRLNLRYFNYCTGLTMTSPAFDELFGGPPRRPESKLEQKHLDMAASIQKVTDEIMLRTVRHAHALTKAKHLCLAGGVALNCVTNGKILREGPFENIWIQPAAGDAGGALGVAWLIWHTLLEQKRIPSAGDAQQGSLLGTEYDDEQIAWVLNACGVVFKTVPEGKEIANHVAGLLAEQLVVGWFQGRMEFGPRALGARSILGDARNAEMQRIMNQKIKFRESFRPFAPAVLREHAHEWFDMAPNADSPYMLIVAGVHPEKCLPVEEKVSGLERIREKRSEIPAVTHVDLSARVQTVDSERHPALHELLSAFHRLTGCPVLMNTSFNVRGEPIVENPEQALDCFLKTDIDVLVMGHYVIMKRDNPRLVPKQHKGPTELD